MQALMNNSFNDYVPYINKEVLPNIHKEAFMDTLNIILDFKIKAFDYKKQNLAWVCSSPPGHGKSTALICFLKMMLDLNQFKQSPILVALNDTEHMNNMYQEIYRYSPDKESQVLYVDHNNVKEIEENITKYLIVIISHQRLRNLAMGLGNYKKYAYHEDLGKRALIIDEMPIFHNFAVFDIGMNNNAIKWFDDCAFNLKLSLEEKTLARGSIAIMIANELIENTAVTTNALIKHLVGSKNRTLVENIIKSIDPKSFLIKSLDSAEKFRWFTQLFNQDNVGMIDSDAKSGAKQIMCSARIDYRKLKLPILILDGTAEYTPLQYNNEYELHIVKNRINYGRLRIRQRYINTSARRRNDVQKKIQKSIAYDFKELGDKKIYPFPLVSKSDIETYKSLDIITEDYAQFYEPKIADSDPLPLNVLNTTGKNHLQNEKALYLTSPPIMHADHYKQIALSLYNGENALDLTMANKEAGRWFNDTRLEAVYLECVIAEMIQIAHRTKLRHLNSPEKIDFAVATSHESIVKLLHSILNVPKKNFYINKVLDGGLHKFDDKVEELANELVKYGKLNFNSTKKGFPYPIGKIGDKYKYKKFINNSWYDEEKRKRIDIIFSKHNLTIEIDSKGWKNVNWLDENKVSQFA